MNNVASGAPRDCTLLAHELRRRGLVLEPQQWAWSSRHCEHGERGAVLVNEPQKAELQVREIA